MADKSEIEWTDASWNSTRGCTKISPGCRNCYAETFAERFRGVYQTRPDPNHKPAEGEKRRVLPVLDAQGNKVPHPYFDGFDPRLAPEQLGLPLTWAKPRKIFVDSMSDLFMKEVPDEYIATVFAVMASCPQHTFQVLTKRAERLPKWFKWWHWNGQLLEDFLEPLSHMPEEAFAALDKHGRWPLDNVQLGVSVEDKKYGLPRIEHLRQVPAAVRFLSVEPLLEDLGAIDLTGIHWVIVGGESGQKARKCELSWIRNVVRQCREQGVPVFVKQLGARATDEQNGVAGARLRLPKESAALVKKRLVDTKGGDMSEWPEDLRIREMPKVRHAQV